MAARTFEMEPDERILLKETSVGEGDWSSCKGELVLTDRALIYVDRGLFGGFRGYTRFRLDEITQALAGTSPNGSHQLEVYHKDGQDNFVFGSTGKRRSVEWKNAIDGQLVRLGRMVADAPEREDDGGRGVAEAIGSVARTGGVIVGGIVRGVGQAALGFVDGLGVTGHDRKPDTPDGRDDALSTISKSCSIASRLSAAVGFLTSARIERAANDNAVCSLFPTNSPMASVPNFFIKLSGSSPSGRGATNGSTSAFMHMGITRNAACLPAESPSKRSIALFANLLISAKCSLPAAVPCVATVFLNPAQYILIASSCPSTTMHAFFSFIADFALSRLNTTAFFLKISVSREFTYLPSSEGMFGVKRVFLAVKAITRPCMSEIGIIILPRKRA